MVTIKTIIFDFDGTIANSLGKIVEIYNSVAPSFHCKSIKQDDIKNLRGKRVREFLKDYGITNLKLPFLLLRVRKELRSKIADIEPITGIVKELQKIKNAGFYLGIMTSNSKENVRIFLDKNGINDDFDFVYSGKNLFGKDKVINRLLKDQGITKDVVIYVGDETRDIEAAKKVGISSLAVTWGFNTKEILAGSAPNQIVDDPEKLLEFLLKFFSSK